MRISLAFLIVAIFCLPSAICPAQSPANDTPAQDPAPAPTLSGLLQPALNTVQQTASAVNLDKWKRGTVRDEAGQHIVTIQKDLQVNLPPLLKSADAAPGTVTRVLPLLRNIDALYDVLLRVVEAARVSAPGDQVGQLEQALVALDKARLAFDDRVQGSANALEKQVSDLRVSLQTQAAARVSAPQIAAVPSCPTTTPARKPKSKPKPKPTTPTTPASSTGTQKSGQ
jgi:hypothetical protein